MTVFKFLRSTFLILALSPAVLFAEKKETKKKPAKINGISSIKWRSVGPALMSGRIGDIAMDPENPNVWYVAAGSGGVWKTSNAGTTFTPIFDNYGSYSIGCVTVDPSQSNIVWVGTGENVGGRHVGYGDGIYQSSDGGKSFKKMGLEKSEHISKILVHPRNSNLVYVASQGPLWSSGGERGLYMSRDGGKTWNLVLSKGKWTGVTDVVMDPSNPSILYAATHQRHRTVWSLVNGGPETGIHKSTDGGKTWRQLKGGLPGGDLGKISLGVSHQDTRVVYATIELPGRKGGIWRTANGGESWAKMSDYTSGGTGPHYYQEIYVDPHRFDVLYHANVYLGRSEDGGKTWKSVDGSRKHTDNHAVVFHPTDKDFLLVGCDGGLYRSFDYAKTYEYFGNLPLTQFYKVDVDYDYPFYNIVGGTQDNNTQYGPSRTRRGTGIFNSDWNPIIGGDGHDCAIDPTNPNIIYCESQKGYLRRYDRRTGESVDIRPQPEKGKPGLRFNWDSPIHISPHDPKVIYHGSKMVHRSDDQGDSWTAISPDLSRNQNRLELKVMDRVWSVDATYDFYAMSMYGNVTSISESPKVEGLIYAGTDDGLIQVTENGGKKWRRVENIEGLPKLSFVNDIKADLFDPDTVYAALDNHKEGDFRPFLLRSIDRGKTWENIGSNLPDRHLVWRVIQDHEKKDLLFVATEFGVFVTLNAGKTWIKMGAGAPNIPFRDLEIQRRENDLVGATFGRSFYVFDDYSYLRHVSEKALKRNKFMIFPVRRAFHYVPERGNNGSQGDGFFLTNNPDFGATFTVYRRDGFKSLRDKRKEEEAKAKGEWGDTKIPSFEDLKAEQEEESPNVYLTIRDKQGNFVQRLKGPGGPGFSRITWNLRAASRASSGSGALVSPGIYSVTFEQEVDGQFEKIGKPQRFKVVSISKPTLPAQKRSEVEAFYAKVEKLSGTVRGTLGRVNEVLDQLKDAEGTIVRARIAKPDLLAEVRKLKKAIEAQRELISSDEIRDEFSEPIVPSVMSRLYGASIGRNSTHGPTKTHRRQYDIAAERFAEVHPKLRKLTGDDLKKLYQKLEQAGVPWSQGRPAPGMRK